MRIEKFKHRFVDRVPEYLDEGILYVCLSCNVVVHLCPCGCREKVVTPIAREHWRFIYDGDGVSLQPSIGNTYFACRSHYFVKGNTIEWLDKMQVNSWPKKQKKENKLIKVLKKIFS